MISPLKWWRSRTRPTSEKPVTRQQAFVMDVEWERSEELRPERLGPSEVDVHDPERVRVERWRPSRTLGPLH